jgi:DNA-binding transcriptional MocR family regulator
MLAFRIFEDAGFGTKLRAIPDHGGIDLEYLRQKLIESEADAATKSTDKPLLKPGRPWAKVYKHVIYCVPSFSNPSGTTMSLDAREGLVRLAREFDVLVIPDDVYDFLHWPVHKPGNIEAQTPRTQPTGLRLPRLIDIDRSLDGGAERPDTDGFGNVCSNGSFSKIVGPGIRVGWVEGTKRFAHGIAET